MSWEMLGFSVKEKWQSQFTLKSSFQVDWLLKCKKQNNNSKDTVEEYLYELSVRNGFLHDTLKKAKTVTKDWENWWH